MFMRNLLSIILGLYLGHWLIKLYYHNLYIHGPDSNVVKKEIHFDQSNQTCYQFIPQPYVCPLNLLHDKSIDP